MNGKIVCQLGHLKVSVISAFIIKWIKLYLCFLSFCKIQSLIQILIITFFICFFSQTASHVKARHELLEGAIGVFPEERQAYEKISLLSWLLPLIAIIGFLVDSILVVVFMKFAHPWKDILFGQLKETKEAQTIESTDIQEEQSKIQVRCYLLYKNR